MEPLTHHIDVAEMRQLQYFAHLLWLGKGEQVDLTSGKYSSRRTRKLFNEEEKMEMFHLSYEEGWTVDRIAQKVEAHPSTVSRFIRIIKKKKGIKIHKNGKYIK